MKKNLLIIAVLLGYFISLKAQTNKNTEHIDQIWASYFNQTRFNNKWGMWADLQLRTKENLVDNFSVGIARLGLTYYITDATRLTLGYAYAYYFPGDNHKKIMQPEHRPWQQLQWYTRYNKKAMAQWFRLEERYRGKILNDSTAGDGYNFNFRLRYSIRYDLPLSKKGLVPGSFSFVVNDEIQVNAGKEVVNNYFDQNRFFVGLKYQNRSEGNWQIGYMNLFQQLNAGNKYRSINAIRFFFYQNFDLRKDK